MRKIRQAGPARNQSGMASIVVVSILIVIMTLISIGFARLMSRSVTNSANRAFSSAATYAAESAINDVGSYLKQYVAANGSSQLPISKNCTGNNSLIGSSSSPGPFYNDSNLSNNNNRSTQYTCILLNPTPDNLQYQQITAGKSRVVKVTTSAASGYFDKLMVSWQPSNSQTTGYPPTPGNLNDETTWNDATHNYIPLLRLTIYPVPVSNNLANVQTKSKTVFLYPQQSSSNVPVQSYDSIKDGSILPVGCTNTVGAATFTGSADYKCNIIINGLATSLGDKSTSDTTLNYVYLRLTPIYNQVDVKIKANDVANQALNFVNVQAIIDATAQTGGVAKRLQARVDTSSLASTTGEDDNISSSSNAMPEQSVRSANAICKRLVETNSYFSYVSFDEPNNVCHDTSNVNTPNPALALSITGHTAPDNGITVDSEANNPDASQNPVQKGTVYIGSGGSVGLNWTSKDATSCVASGGWSGDQAPSMSWSGTTGTGSKTFSGITSRTAYSLQCSRAGGGNTPSTTFTTPTRTVTAWPPPVVSLSNPSTVEAGQTYSVSWSTPNNAAVRCALSGSWPDLSQTGTSGSESYTWPSQDNTSTRTYTVTCYDPIGRSDTKTWTVSPNGGGGGGDGNGGGTTKVLPPNCSASAWLTGSTTSDATINWSTNCDYYDQANVCEADRMIDTNIPNIPNGYASPCYYGNGSVRITQTGNYHFQIYVWAPPWSSQSAAASYGGTTGAGLANSGTLSFSVHDQVTGLSLSSPSGLWDQSPQCYSPGNSWNGSWWCHWDGHNRTTWPNGGGICADGSHQWTLCGVSWSSSAGGDTGNITCSVSSSNGSVFVSGLGSGGTRLGPDNGGWGWPYNPNNFTLACSTPWSSASISAYIP